MFDMFHFVGLAPPRWLLITEVTQTPNLYDGSWTGRESRRSHVYSSRDGFAILDGRDTGADREQGWGEVLDRLAREFA